MADNPQEVWVTVDGERFLVKVEDLGRNPVVAYVDGRRFEVFVQGDQPASGGVEIEPLQAGKPASVAAGQSCQVTAPMPGDIVEILVQAGQVVQAADPLCVLDAMKMKNTIHSPQAGRIAEICVTAGQCVEFGTPLIRLE